jgi:hypothetical protein
MSRWARRNGIDKLEREGNDDTRHRRDRTNASPRVAWLGSRVILLLAAALIVGSDLAASAPAQVSDQTPAVNPFTLTPERIAASVAAVVGLTGVVIGGLALARSAGRIGAGTGRREAIVALVMGPIGLVIGGLVVATADGGLGTGNGLGGGLVAMTVGLIGITLGWLALSRSRRIA